MEVFLNNTIFIASTKILFELMESYKVAVDKVQGVNEHLHHNKIQHSPCFYVIIKARSTTLDLLVPYNITVICVNFITRAVATVGAPF